MDSFRGGFLSQFAQKSLETFRLRKRKLDGKVCILGRCWHGLRLPLECQISKYFSICFWESSCLGIFAWNESLLRNNCLMFLEAYRRCNFGYATKIFLHNFWQRVNFCQKMGFKKPNTRKLVFWIFRSTLGKIRYFSQTLLKTLLKEKDIQQFQRNLLNLVQCQWHELQCWTPKVLHFII